MPTDTESDYDRGRAAGEVAARLAGHDRQLAAINGSLAAIAGELRALALAVQRLADQAVAARTADVDRRGLPGRVLALAAAAATVAGAAVAAYLALHR